METKILQSYETMLEIDVRPFGPKGRDLKIHGYADVTVAGITIKNLRILSEEEGKLFVGMPKSLATKSEAVYIQDPEMRAIFDKAVIRTYHETVEKARNNTQREGASFTAAIKKTATYNNEAQEPEKKKSSGKEVR